MMWKVAVATPFLTACSTVEGKTSMVSCPMPKMKLPLIMMPRSPCRNRHAEIVKFMDGFVVGVFQISGFICVMKIIASERFETDKDATEPGATSKFDRVVFPNGIDADGPLKKAAHPAHLPEKDTYQFSACKQMVV